LSSNVNPEPNAYPDPSATNLSPQEFDLVVLTSQILRDAKRAHDDADHEIESWHTILHNVA
jgi:hypothetical protein